MGKVIFSKQFWVFGKAFAFEIEVGSAFVFGVIWAKPDLALIIGCFAFILERRVGAQPINGCCVPARTFDDL